MTVAEDPSGATDWNNEPKLVILLELLSINQMNVFSQIQTEVT